MSAVVLGEGLVGQAFRVPSDVIAARAWFTQATSALPFSNVIAVALVRLELREHLEVRVAAVVRGWRSGRR